MPTPPVTDKGQDTPLAPPAKTRLNWKKQQEKQKQGYCWCKKKEEEKKAGRIERRGAKQQAANEMAMQKQLDVMLPSAPLP